MFGKKEKDNFSRYEDPSGEFTNRELKWAEWYLQNKEKLYKTVVGFLLTWCIVTMGIGVGYFTYYFSYAYFQDQEMFNRQTTEFVDYRSMQIKYKAKDLQVFDVDVFNSVSELYDFVARIKNPNDNWIAKIVYKFSFSNGETDLAQTTILPGQDRPVAFFGYDSLALPRGVSFEIVDTSWQRVDNHDIADAVSYISQRINFPVENFEFTRASASKNITSNIIKFDIFNDSAFSYWEVPVYVEILEGNQSRGIIYLVLDKFKTQEIRSVDLRSTVNNLNVTNIRIWPIINVFDDSVYLPFDYQ